MKISHETRIKQRLTIFRTGKFLVKAALILGMLGFVFTTLKELLSIGLKAVSI
jgi:hypothetical protein